MIGFACVKSKGLCNSFSCSIHCVGHTKSCAAERLRWVIPSAVRVGVVDMHIRTFQDSQGTSRACDTVDGFAWGSAYSLSSIGAKLKGRIRKLNWSCQCKLRKISRNFLYCVGHTVYCMWQKDCGGWSHPQSGYGWRSCIWSACRDIPGTVGPYYTADKSTWDLT